MRRLVISIHSLLASLNLKHPISQPLRTDFLTSFCSPHPWVLRFHPWGLRVLGPMAHYFTSTLFSVLFCFQLACKPLQAGDYNVFFVCNQELGILHHVLRKHMAGLNIGQCHLQKRNELYSRNGFFLTFCIFY